MVHEYYVQTERELARRRAEARAQVKTKAQLLRLQAELRRKIRRCFAHLPRRRTPLNARTTGLIERREYTIEKVIYESRPNLPVTANLYIPRGVSSPRPAVLGTCGHTMDGKAYHLYQSFAAGLARQGYVVLVYDPLGQGERSQFTARDGRHRPVGCTREHNMMGNQMTLLGEYFGCWRAWDGIRSLDYLLSRPEVDPTRVGVTGNSGGGTMTTFLSALDARFTMAAPSCFVTTYLHNLENEEPQDAEQCPPGFLAAGMEMADFFIARIPRPLLLLGQEKDFFDDRGLRAVYEELRRLYAVAGAPDNVELFIGPREHGYFRENREAMYRFFNRHARVRASGREPRNPRLEPVSALWATPRGQVLRLKGARRVFEFTRESANELARRRRAPSARALLAAIQKRLALPKRPAPPHHRRIRLYWPVGDGYQAHAGFAVETEPGIQALIHVCRPEKVIRCFPRYRRATLFVPHTSAAEDVTAGLAPKATPLLAVEVRGIGHAAARTCASGGFFDPYGSDYMYADHGMMLNRPYAGQRVHDLLSVLDLLAAYDCREVHLVGRGLGAIWATFAACLHPLVKRVTLHNALGSYHELTQVPVYRWPLSALVPGVLEDFDLPDCYRLLRARKRLRIVRPWDAQMRPGRQGPSATPT